jgi:glycosyltransferase involved in cell wall biosynthesis
MSSSVKILNISNMIPSPKYQSYGVFVDQINADINRIPDVSSVLIGVGYCESIFVKLYMYMALYVKSLWLILFNSYSHILIHSSTHFFPIVLAAKIKSLFVNSNVVIYSHGGDIYLEHVKGKGYSSLLKILSFFSYLVADSIFVSSQASKSVLSSKFGEKVCIQYPTSIREIFFALNGGCHKDLVSTDHINFYITGRLVHGKGVISLLDSIKFPELSIVNVIGDGPMRNRVELMCDQPGRVFLGNLSHLEMSSVYHSTSGFFIFNSRLTEGLGLVVLEAMASGLVPFVRSNTGVAELIDHGVNGYVYSDLQELQHLISNVLKLSKGRLNKMRGACISVALNFNHEYGEQLKSNLVK